MKEIPTLSFSEAINNAANNVFQFQGRSRRSEYWWTKLLVFLANIVLTPLGGFLLGIAIIPLTFRRLHDVGKSGWWWGIGIILQFVLLMSVIYDLLVVGLSTRDFYGIDGSMVAGYVTKYLVWILILLAYKLTMLVFLCMDSEQHDNRYGKSPKYVAEEQ